MPRPSLAPGKKPKLGLALGGGMARGIAHLGVLMVLAEAGIPIYCLAGTSAGSLVGGLYAAGLSLSELQNLALSLNWASFVRPQIPRAGLVSSEPIETYVRHCVGRVLLQDLRLPFAAVATNMQNGAAVILREPELEVAQVIRASSSFPGIFSPMQINQSYYCDGGASANLPIQAAYALGADRVLAIDVIPQVSLQEITEGFIANADRGLDLLLKNTSRLDVQADLLLQPVTENIHSFQLGKAEALIKLGKKAAEANIKAIERLCK